MGSGIAQTTRARDAETSHGHKNPAHRCVALRTEASDGRSPEQFKDIARQGLQHQYAHGWQASEKPAGAGRGLIAKQSAHGGKGGRACGNAEGRHDHEPETEPPERQGGPKQCQHHKIARGNDAAEQHGFARRREHHIAQPARKQSPHNDARRGHTEQLPSLSLIQASDIHQKRPTPQASEADTHDVYPCL